MPSTLALATRSANVCITSVWSWFVASASGAVMAESARSSGKKVSLKMPTNFRRLEVQPTQSSLPSAISILLCRKSCNSTECSCCIQSNFHCSSCWNQGFRDWYEERNHWALDKCFTSCMQQYPSSKLASFHASCFWCWLQSEGRSRKRHLQIGKIIMTQNNEDYRISTCGKRESKAYTSCIWQRSCFQSFHRLRAKIHFHTVKSGAVERS